MTTRSHRRAEELEEEKGNPPRLPFERCPKYGPVGCVALTECVIGPALSFSTIPPNKKAINKPKITNRSGSMKPNEPASLICCLDDCLKEDKKKIA